MTFEELKRQIKNINIAYDMELKVSCREQSVYIGDVDKCYAIIKSNIPHSLYISGINFEQILNDNLRFDLLKAVYKFAQTSLDARHLFSRFHISSKLTPKNNCRFLFKEGGNIDCLAWGWKQGEDTEFTQEEIDYICDKFHTDLSDFDIDEVK